MSNRPGRPFLYLATALSGWMVCRVVLLAAGGDSADDLAMQATAREAGTVFIDDATSVALDSPLVPAQFALQSGTSSTRAKHSSATIARRWPIPFPASSVTRPWVTGGQPSGSPPVFRVASPGESPVREQGTTPLVPATEKKAGTLSGEVVHPPRRISFYGYSFWRTGRPSAQPGLAAAPQYGGSQSGLIALWHPIGNANTAPALMGRLAASPDSNATEAAVGVRWQPDRQVPVGITVERRFRSGEADHMAAYIAGGTTVGLTVPVRLDLYGQAGYSFAKQSGGFFDGSARLVSQKRLSDMVTLDYGGGAWTGGQRDAQRLDIGPSARLSVRNGGVAMNAQIDMRLRIAGQAAPAKSIALTLSSGF